MSSPLTGPLGSVLLEVWALSWLLLLVLAPVVCQNDVNLTLACANQCTCSVKSHTSEVLIVNCTGITSIPQDIPLRASELLFSHSLLASFNLADLPHLKHCRRLVLDHCSLSEFLSLPELVEKLPSLEVLDLSHNDLKAIPAGLLPSLKTLVLSHNAIGAVHYQSVLAHLSSLEELFLGHNILMTVKASTFHDDQSPSSLHSVRKLELSSNQLDVIEDGAFVAFDSLTALTLANNQLNSLSRGLFTGLRSLRHLDISNNRLTRVDEEAFRGLEQLKYINISRNRLTSFPSNLPMLEWLDLSHNLIRVIDEDLKLSVYPIEVLNLAHNPLHCDCHMRWLKELYDQREYLVEHLKISAKDFVPGCATPASLAGETWDLLGDEVFTCSPADVHQGMADVSADVALNSRIGAVTDTTIQMMWTSGDALSSASTNIVIHHYVFGHRQSTMKRIEVSAAQPSYVIRRLRPSTNYIICVQARHIGKDQHPPSSPAPVSLSDCMEVVTKDPKPPQLTSRLEVLFYYVLGMLATFIGIFAAIGGFAMLYGIWNSGTQWSARYIGMDSYLDGTSYPTDEPVMKDNKPHTD